MSGGRAGISARLFDSKAAPSLCLTTSLFTSLGLEKETPHDPRGRAALHGSGPGSQVAGGPSGFALLPPFSPLGTELTSSLSVAGRCPWTASLTFSSEGLELRCHLIKLPVKQVGSSTQTHTFTRGYMFSKTPSPHTHTFMCTHIHIRSDTHPHRLLSILSLIHSFTLTYTHTCIYTPSSITHTRSHMHSWGNNTSAYVNSYHMLTCTHTRVHMTHMHTHTMHTPTLTHMYSSHFLWRS